VHGSTMAIYGAAWDRLRQTETGGAKQSEAHRTQAGSPRCLVQSGGGGSQDEADGDDEVFRRAHDFS